ncbi:type I-E CRISPR-associated protein Cas6/Cse3/CasE [Rubellimicrobium roseum]|uniref:Type I-E CRISPR-associated protein Cas6/Cse3/CasE n=1 Tax=Rubellimicrobium roseum TaxID=687525 RepID=A0A5C4NB71_9RHOB|nr:type I-E CRISPR-associated protein Cas6/Cse3/CasE [Rubellimicrobium roseum]TNC72034.1 type I-E CRISPR-associated protein Cas6/Cse3/CasE [Rubellimicrobium roseum]
MTLFLSRLALSRTPSAAALAGLLDPEDASRAMDAHHRLLWTLFADGPDRRRDFLWRAEGQGRFLVLSQREPLWAAGGLFDQPEVKEFAPDLRAGDRLGFMLRVNATRTRRIGAPGADGKPGRVHVDVVMDALHGLPSGRVSEARSGARMALAQEKGAAWLAEQGSKHGFEAQGVTVSDYAVVALPSHRGPRKGQPQFGVLETTGMLKVTEPGAFLGRIAEGFGRAKAFGCGLMLIRRAA